MKAKLAIRFTVWTCLILQTIACTTLVAKADWSDDISLEGGETTIDDATAKGYDYPIANLYDSKALQKHDLGREGFHRNFARSAINGKIRVGPKFNNVSCVSCHANNGRGEPKFAQSGSQSVIKISRELGQPLVPGGPVPLPKLGLQFRDHSIQGTKADGKVELTWEMLQKQYPDGTPYQLRKPILTITGVKAGFLAATMMSLRRPPAVFGSGLLDAVDPATIISLADPYDSNNDGISGSPNQVWNIARKSSALGKFGWKAAAPTVAQQIATAYAVDMGVTNDLVPTTDSIPDMDQQTLARNIYYSQTLAVPMARDQNLPEVQRGKELFASLNCSGCHVMTMITGNHRIKELSNQTIHPFTDLLLHDMGTELADNRPEFLASGTEWRTPPLWGIGLAPLALKGKEENYLHDGRARTLEEAILWHGGEALNANTDFQNLPAEDRASLIAFLKSL